MDRYFKSQAKRHLVIQQFWGTHYAILMIVEGLCTNEEFIISAHCGSKWDGLCPLLFGSSNWAVSRTIRSFSHLGQRFLTWDSWVFPQGSEDISQSQWPNAVFYIQGVHDDHCLSARAPRLK